jgi:hypothetical protein
MDSNPDLIERIDAMGISIERNLAVTVLFVNIVAGCPLWANSSATDT